MLRRQALATAIASALAVPAVHAAEIPTADPDWKVRWDNSVKYTAAVRVKDRAEVLTRDTQQSDGDSNFGKGLVANRVDLLSELDVTYKSVGVRISGAAWYDNVYQRSTDNDRPDALYNPASVSKGTFTDATRKLHGRKAEILDAFVFGSTEIGEMTLTGRLGRHTLLYGESLYFLGIAGGMGPTDGIKALSVPNTQAKEIFRPVNQISGQLQFRPNMSVGAYYQFEWDKTRIPASGSYFSPVDLLDAGGERILAGPAGAENSIVFTRGQDLKARDSGQGGAQLRWTPEGSNVDLGFYAIRYHDKTPQVYIRPNGGFNPANNAVGDYVAVYHENIRAFGASASITLGASNIAGEISVHRNVPLTSQAQTDPAALTGSIRGDNDDNPLYPVGNTAQAQVSTITTLPSSFLADEASFSGEFAVNRMTSITRNPQALDPNASRGGWGVRGVYEPTYRRVTPSIDVSVPVGLGYAHGRSAAGSFGPNKGGDISIGLNATYLSVWNFGLTYTHYYGAAEVSSVNNTMGGLQGTMSSFKQNYKDRDFIAFSARATF